MGVSTDGILCYGFSVVGEDGRELEDESPAWLKIDDEDETMDFDDFLAKLEGLVEPEYDHDRYQVDPVMREQMQTFWAEKRKLEEKVGIKLIHHCSGDYPLYILAITESCHRASRGYPQTLGQTIEANPEWRDKLKAFCERAGITFQEPQYILCSYWG